MEAEGLEPKTIRNLWATVRLIREAALAQKYADSLPPKPKLPRLSKKRPRYFRLEGIGRIIAHSKGELRTFYWLAAESGMRAGELCALRLVDVEPDRLTVNQVVWHGRIQDGPKTNNGVRAVPLSLRRAWCNALGASATSAGQGEHAATVGLTRGGAGEPGSTASLRLIARSFINRLLCADHV
jgi:integrase